MTVHFGAPGPLVLSVLALTLASPSWAQQAPAGGSQAPAASTPMPIHQPQPTTVPGRPDTPNAEVNAKLRGVAPPPIPAPEDKLPVAQLKVPKGFKVEVYASGIGNARSLRLGDKGTVFVSNRLLDKVYAVVDRDGKRQVKVIASGLDRPNGLAFHKGTLYIAEGTRISKLESIEDKLDNPGSPTVIYSDFLNHQSHGWKFMGLGPD
jgi:glucose/arabinose dehydrogenase